MSRFDLQTGQGHLAVLLDLTTGEIDPYTVETAQRIHAERGGRMFYQSRSGLSCAGWVPARPGLAVPATYRVDTAHPEWIRHGTKPTLGDLRFVVPVDYRGRRIAYSYPAIGWTEWGTFYVSPCSSLGVEDLLRETLSPESALRSSFRLTHPEWFDFTDGLPGHSVQACIHIHESLSPTEEARASHVIRRSIVPAFKDAGLAPNFCWRLGLRLTADGLYKIRGGIAEEVVPRDELSWAAIRRLATSTAQFLDESAFGGPTYLAQSMGPAGPSYAVHRLARQRDRYVSSSVVNIGVGDALQILWRAAPEGVLRRMEQNAIPFDQPIPVWS